VHPSDNYDVNDMSRILSKAQSMAVSNDFPLLVPHSSMMHQHTESVADSGVARLSAARGRPQSVVLSTQQIYLQNLN